MKIRFQPHAVERMQERFVTVAEVNLILEAPDGRIPQSKEKSILYKRFPRRKDNLVAAVVVEKISEDEIEIVTLLVNFEVRK